MSTLSKLSAVTLVVADTGDIDSIRKFKPQDATTNPSLILAAIQKPEYMPLLDQAIAYSKAKSGPADVDMIYDKLCVLIGKEILKLVPGVVSTEVDARLAFDVKKTVEKARLLIAMYAEEGISKDRILIKVASSWEGMCACKTLQSEGIQCNMTLIFNFAQALAAANAGAFLISPFVGRIRDWYMKKEGRTDPYPTLDDPGVKSVREIYAYFKAHGIKTVVMGASFRTDEEVLGLAGCDRLTISPALLEKLGARTDEEPVHVIGEAEFRWALNGALRQPRASLRADDPMACELLCQGIRAFGVDTVKTLQFIQKRL